MRTDRCLVTFMACAPWTTASVLSSRAHRHHEGKGQDTHPRLQFREYRIEPSNAPTSGTISRDEFDLIQRSLGVIERWSDKPDCFRVAAKNIRSQCGDVDMDEKQRIITSISMTLCEIATGSHYSIPLECQTFSSSGPVSSQQPSPPVDAVEASRCVDALSRSAQFWSSYSGYLREMPQLCYAFRQWNEIDLAKDLYQNVTLEKIELINLLLTRERELSVLVGAWGSHVDTLLLQAGLVADRFDTIYASLSKKLSEVIGEVTANIQAETSHLIRQRDESESYLREIMADRIQEVLIAHTASMEAVKTDMQSFTQSLRGNILEILVAVGHRTTEVLDDLSVQWQGSRLLLDEIHLLSKQIIWDSRQLSGNILGLVDQTGALRNQQSLIFSQYSVLSGKTSELTEMAQNALHEINETMVDMKAAYAREGPSRGDHLWHSCMTWILERLLRFDSTSAEELVHIPLFSGLAVVVGSLASILRVGASVSMSAMVVLYLTSRHLVTRLAAILSVSQTNLARGSPDSWRKELPHLVVYGPTLSATAEAELKNQLRGCEQNGKVRVALSRGYGRSRRGRVSRIPDWLCQSGL